MSRSYSEDDAEAILKLASRKSLGGNVSQEKLMATAAELGISVEAVLEAEQEYVSTREDQENRLAYRKYRRGKFTGQIAATVGFAVLLGGIDYYTSGGFNWVFWCFIWWGFQLVDSAKKAFVLAGSEYERSYARWLQKKQAGIDPNLDEDEDEGRSRRLRRGYQMQAENRQRLEVGARRGSDWR